MGRYKRKQQGPNSTAKGDDGLTYRRRVFIAAYLSNGYNATEAAIKAGYKCKDRLAAGVTGCGILKTPNVRAIIRKYFEEAGMSREEVIARLAEQAKANPAKFFDAKWRLNRKELEARGHLVKKLKAPSRGKAAEIELHDGQAALVKLGVHLGLFNEKVQHVGDQGGPIRHEFTVNVTADELGATGPKEATP